MVESTKRRGRRYTGRGCCCGGGGGGGRGGGNGGAASNHGVKIPIGLHGEKRERGGTKSANVGVIWCCCFWREGQKKALTFCKLRERDDEMLERKKKTSIYRERKWMFHISLVRELNTVFTFLF